MKYYPTFIKLEGKRCVVVGAGQVGRRKIAALLECGPESLLVVDTSPPEGEMAELAEHPAVDYQTRDFDPADLEGAFLVVACTDSEDVNWQISRLCAAKNTLCNIVDQPEKCSFIVPAIYRQGELTVAVSTGGASPALAKKIRQDLDSTFGEHYAAFLTLMARVRPLVLGLGRPTADNTALFREMVASGLMEALATQERDKAHKILVDLLPPELAQHIPDLLDGLC